MCIPNSSFVWYVSFPRTIGKDGAGVGCLVEGLMLGEDEGVFEGLTLGQDEDIVDENENG